MPTTTFTDIKFTEDVENYRYEDEDYTWNKGDVVSLPRHTAYKFVNKWNRAEWAKPPYEVRDEDYDAVVGRVKDQEGGYSYDELQDLAKENDVKANQSREDLEEELRNKDVI